MKVRIFQILGPPWSWLYGSWICNSNYLCNQCLSWLKLWAGSWCGVFDTTLCDKVCQWLATGQWFSPGTPVYSTNKTDRYDIAKILLNVTLNTITLTLFQIQSNPIWLKSYISPAPHYWNVMVWDIWWNPIKGRYMQVIPLYHPMKVVIAKLWKCC